MPRPPWLVAAFVTAVVTAACGVKRPAVQPDPRTELRLTLLDTVVMPSIPRPPDGRRDRWFGSLSGLARDEASGRYLAAIDDREPARVAWLQITAANGRLSVAPGDVVAVLPRPGLDDLAVRGADLESIVALPDGTWVASEEGHVSAGRPGVPAGTIFQPALVTLDAGLRAVQYQAWPPRFLLGPGREGIRDNQGFEALARTPDGRLIAGLEQPLYADMTVTLRNRQPFGGGRGGPGRLIELVASGDGADDRDPTPADGWRPRREWVYPLDATAVRPGEQICDDGENGLTELLALDNMTLVALERACLLEDGTLRARNTARLYVVDLANTDDPAPTSGAAVASARRVRKRLLVDFDSLVPQLPPALARLDNFEALAFGPALEDGRRTLLVVSDDNFRATQHTVFVWFRLDEN